MPGAFRSPIIHQTVVIGLATFPPAGVKGSVKVKAPRKKKNDKKSPSGKNGGRTTTQGTDLVEVEIEITYQDGPTADGKGDQYDLVKDEIDKIWPDAGPQGIGHAATDFANVRDVDILEVDSPDPQAGWFTLKIKAREFKRDTATGGTGGTGSGSATTSADLAEIRAKIANLEAMLATSRPVTPNSFAEQVQWINELAQLRAEEEALNTATKTATSSQPTKQFSGPAGAPKPVTGKAGVPLGEIQP